MTYPQEQKTLCISILCINGDKPWENPDVGINIKYFKELIIIMLKDVKENMFTMNEIIENLKSKIESIEKNEKEML